MKDVLDLIITEMKAATLPDHQCNTTRYCKESFVQLPRNNATHCGIGKLLSTAYLWEFRMMEMGKCKTKFPTFKDWHATLNDAHRQRINQMLIAEYWE